MCDLFCYFFFFLVYCMMLLLFQLLSLTQQRGRTWTKHRLCLSLAWLSVEIAWTYKKNVRYVDQNVKYVNIYIIGWFDIRFDNSSTIRPFDVCLCLFALWNDVQEMHWAAFGSWCGNNHLEREISLIHTIQSTHSQWISKMKTYK